MNPVMYTAASADYKFKRSDIKQFTGDNIFTNGIMEAKRYKVLGHQFYPTNDTIIWIDSNITLLSNIEQAIEQYLGNYDLVVFKHPHRNCIYKEFEVLKNDKRFQIPYLQNQIVEQEKHYRKIGHPENYGLWECNFIIRRNTTAVNNLFNDWWAEICRWQWRDQVSFPVVLRRHLGKIKFNSFDGWDIRKRSDFLYKWHY